MHITASHDIQAHSLVHKWGGLHISRRRKGLAAELFLAKRPWVRRLRCPSLAVIGSVAKTCVRGLSGDDLRLPVSVLERVAGEQPTDYAYACRPRCHCSAVRICMNYMTRLAILVPDSFVLQCWVRIVADGGHHRNRCRQFGQRSLGDPSDVRNSSRSSTKHSIALKYAAPQGSGTRECATGTNLGKGHLLYQSGVEFLPSVSGHRGTMAACVCEAAYAFGVW